METSNATDYLRVIKKFYNKHNSRFNTNLKNYFYEKV